MSAELSLSDFMNILLWGIAAGIAFSGILLWMFGITGNIVQDPTECSRCGRPIPSFSGKLCEPCRMNLEAEIFATHLNTTHFVKTLETHGQK